MANEKKSADASDGKTKKRGIRLCKPRIEPAKKDSWTAGQRTLLEPLENKGRVYNVFATLANHPELMRSWFTFATYVLGRNLLPPREREIVILRIGWLCNAEYEWAQHVRIGRKAGLSDDDIRRIRVGPEADGLSALDRLLLEATDELHADAFISDETWNALCETYTVQQMMDLVFTVGQYNLVSMALNCFGVQLDANLAGFNEPA